MTVISAPPPPKQPRTSNTTRPAPLMRSRASRWPLITVLILSLVGAGAMREVAGKVRGKTVHVGETNSTTPLSRMDSFALALLLGGLRGPLVMVLWTSSESQKQDKDLEDFDTKVEWIRLLQPEFDTVHIFQIWNKAYNISVLKASLANKYLTILDAIDYAKRVNSERPDDINIIYAIGGVYFDKLGQSQEKAYYTARVRRESLPHERPQKLSPDDPAWRRLDLDPILDKDGNILPDYLKPTSILLTDPNDPTARYDGSELQFLAKYGPYPDGLSPLALGYNYQKRASMLQQLGHQRHAQLGDMVIDSRPPLTLEFWSEEELSVGRKLELAALSRAIPDDHLEMEQTAASLPLDTPLDEKQRAGLEHARTTYDRSTKIGVDSLNEYIQHVTQYKQNLETSRMHMETLAADVQMSAADRDYLGAMLAVPSARPALLAAAHDGYQRALIANELIILHYYLSDPLAKKLFPPGYNRGNIDSLNPAAYPAIIEELKRRTYVTNENSESQDDMRENLSYLGRIATRLSTLEH